MGSYYWIERSTKLWLRNSQILGTVLIWLRANFSFLSRLLDGLSVVYIDMYCNV